MGEEERATSTLVLFDNCPGVGVDLRVTTPPPTSPPSSPTRKDLSLSAVSWYTWVAVHQGCRLFGFPNYDIMPPIVVNIYYPAFRLVESSLSNRGTRFFVRESRIMIRFCFFLIRFTREFESIDRSLCRNDYARTILFETWDFFFLSCLSRLFFFFFSKTGRREIETGEIGEK